MSDRRMRELERRWRASGAPGDGEACLRERIRVDSLTEDRLELLAYLSMPGARAVLGDEALVPSRDLGVFVGFLERWFGDLDVHTQVIALKTLAANVTEDLDVIATVQACCAWSACPCRSHVATARRATNPIRTEYLSVVADMNRRNPYFTPRQERLLTTSRDVLRLAAWQVADDLLPRARARGAPSFALLSAIQALKAARQVRSAIEQGLIERTLLEDDGDRPRAHPTNTAFRR